MGYSFDDCDVQHEIEALIQGDGTRTGRRDQEREHSGRYFLHTKS